MSAGPSCPETRLRSDTIRLVPAPLIDSLYVRDGANPQGAKRPEGRQRAFGTKGQGTHPLGDTCTPMPGPASECKSVAPSKARIAPMWVLAQPSLG